MGPETAKESPTPVNCVRRAGSGGECSSGDRTATSRKTSGVKRATAAKRLLSFDEKSGTAERTCEPDGAITDGKKPRAGRPWSDGYGQSSREPALNGVRVSSCWDPSVR